METGLLYRAGTCRFRVWAPEKENVSLRIVYPNQADYLMKKLADGYHEITLDQISTNTKYLFGIEGEFFPDPASHAQPNGVHGPSCVIDHEKYRWNDQLWKGIPFEQLVIYELHVGTFSEAGTFDAVIPHLDYLIALGINAIELMPVARFPGSRNWGYDVVYPFAPQENYGEPNALKKLVDSCHNKGIAVILDVIYNHLGPEGNYFKQYGPYFSKKYTTPWGEALNLDGEWSDGVRTFILDNMQYWFEHFHIDGLRCDAVHEIYDSSAVHIWDEATDRIQSIAQRTGRQVYLIAESDTNNPKVVMPRSLGGFGFRAQWLDDFQHAVYELLNPCDKERYAGFGKITHLAKAFDQGFVHSGEFVEVRKKRHGACSIGISPDHFVVFNDNHDQTGNRPNGERTASFFDLDRLKLSCVPSLLSPYIPMLFMGEEFGAKTPFHFFVDHSDPDLLEAVKNGRKKEFESFNGISEPADPGALSTFIDSKLNWNQLSDPESACLLAWYKKLIAIRQSFSAFQTRDRQFVKTNILSDKVLELVRTDSAKTQVAKCLFNFGDQEMLYQISADTDEVEKILDSNDPEFCMHNIPPKDNKQQFLKGETLLLQPFSVVVLVWNSTVSE